MKTILFNPVGTVHDRNIEKFENVLSEWNIRRLYNPNLPWASSFRKDRADTHFFTGGRVPDSAFKDVKAVVCFSAQPRIPFSVLAEEALLRSIPVIAIEEVYQMALQQGHVNEYFLPVDHLFVGSDYEKDAFLEIGVPEGVVEVTGCPFRIEKEKGTSDIEEKRNIKRMLGCDPEKPLAVVCLTLLTPDGETREVRQRILGMVSKEMPESYELIVKAHPAEDKKNLEAFVKESAPRAKVVDSHMPIEKILKATDILFNRSNSQVVIDAIDKQVPVIALPLGKRSLFHGLIEEVIADKPGDIKNILELIKARGMGLYNPIFEKYLSITPEEALGRAASRIAEIAESKDLYKPEVRLLEFGLFWAWMGYPSQSFRVFDTLERFFQTTSEHVDAARQLLSCKATHEDIDSLKEWASHGYREWIIKSLWIRSLYLNRSKMDDFDVQWLADFPPRMNRYHFLSFTRMLGWCYKRSGLQFDKNISSWREQISSNLKTSLKDIVFSHKMRH